MAKIFTTSITKPTNQSLVISSFISFAGLVCPAGAQFVPLDSVAAKYDIFIMENNSGVDNSFQVGRNGVTFTGLLGVQRGISSQLGKDVLVTKATVFDGVGRWHSGLNGPGTFKEFNLDPTSTGTNFFSGFDVDLDAADALVKSYITDLRVPSPFGVTPTNVGVVAAGDGPVSYTASSALTVLDFTSIARTGSTDSFTLNGRSGHNDVFIIRLKEDGDLTMGGGAPVILNNLNRDNVLWVGSSGGSIDLHQNDGANFEGVIFHQGSGTGGADGTILGDVNFTGRAYLGSAQIGTGVQFTGSSLPGPTVPEPSTPMMPMGVFCALIFYRRR